MNWEQAIERQRSALASIVAVLFAMAGLSEGCATSRLPHPAYRAVLRILYPAEAAVRRLIVAAARGLEAKLPQPRPAAAGRKARIRKAHARMAFRLFDPPRSLVSAGRKPACKFAPRIHAFSGGELVTIVGSSPLAPAQTGGKTADATRLGRRLAAVQSALENLPREAKRLARWRARMAAKPPEKRRALLRFGPPPGHRRSSRHEVDEILKDCHWLAREAARPDTS